MDDEQLKELQDASKERRGIVTELPEQDLLLTPPKEPEVNVLEDDNPVTIAHKIFNDFILRQNCTIKGYIDTPNGVERKGDLVLNELRELDMKANFIRINSKARRKRKLIPNSIGGYVAHKIFKFEYRDLNHIPHVTIWRLQ